MIIKFPKTMPTLIVGVLVLSIWASATAGIFCPHMRGDRNCFLVDQPHVDAKHMVRDASAPVEHLHHEQMSDMDKEEGSMERSQPDQLLNSEQTSDVSSTNDLGTRTSSNEQAITQANEPCPHCLMHSRSGERFPLSIVANSTSDQIVLAEFSVAALNLVPVPHTIVELHDHSPPGSNTPLYVLASAFRI